MKKDLTEKLTIGLNLDIPTEIYIGLKKIAKKEDRSVKSLVRTLIKKYVEENIGKVQE